MTAFDIAYANAIQYEGSYTNDSVDRGGETYKGISRVCFPESPLWKTIDAAKTSCPPDCTLSAYLDSSSSLQHEVKEWYQTTIWDAVYLDDCPQKVANELFEQIVHLGQGGAVKHLQRLCNALNYDQTTETVLFPDLIIDGLIGPKTMGAFKQILERRISIPRCIHILNALQTVHYLDIASVHISQRKYLRGWLTRTVL